MAVSAVDFLEGAVVVSKRMKEQPDYSHVLSGCLRVDAAERADVRLRVVDGQ
jgi:hypothetical protein